MNKKVELKNSVKNDDNTVFKAKLSVLQTWFIKKDISDYVKSILLKLKTS